MWGKSRGAQAPQNASWGRAKFAVLLGTAALAAVSSANAQAITYTGTEYVDSDTVNFSITTDGTLGALASDNITAFNVSITDPYTTEDINTNVDGIV